MTKLDRFVKRLKAQAHEKAQLYDGEGGLIQRVGHESTLEDYSLRLATEELGEIASALTRNRRNLAKEECIDLAHCAFLLWAVLDGGQNTP